MRRVYDSYDDTPDFYIDIDVSLVMDRRSTLDKKVAVLPLLCAASLQSAYWCAVVRSAAANRRGAQK